MGTEAKDFVIGHLSNSNTNTDHIMYKRPSS